jgi:hypothetical protein
MRRRVVVLLAVSALAGLDGGAVSGAPPAADVRCDYSNRIECTASGCTASPIAGAYLMLPDAPTLLAATARASDAASLPAIRICDATGCTPIGVRAARSGAFANIAQEGGAHFVKVALVDIPPRIRAGDFLEVSARFLTTVTLVGSCPALVRPAAGK